MTVVLIIFIYPGPSYQDSGSRLQRLSAI